MNESDLLEHLHEQVYFIEKSIKDYENNEIEAKRVATHIRTLVHDTSNSVSLLKKLDLKDIMFVDTNAPKDAFSYWSFNNVEISSGVFNNSPYIGIVGKELSRNSDGTISIKYLPIYNTWTNFTPNIDFDTWWNTEIYDNKNGDILTRKGLILNVANKDGGAHIDNLKQEYKSFKNHNIMQFNVNGSLQGFDNIPAYAAVMQIARELIETIKTKLSISS